MSELETLRQKLKNGDCHSQRTRLAAPNKGGPFHNVRISSSGDRLIVCCLKTACDGFWSLKMSNSMKIFSRWFYPEYFLSHKIAPDKEKINQPLPLKLFMKSDFWPFLLLFYVSTFYSFLMALVILKNKQANLTHVALDTKYQVGLLLRSKGHSILTPRPWNARIMIHRA